METVTDVESIFLRLEQNLPLDLVDLDKEPLHNVIRAAISNTSLTQKSRKTVFDAVILTNFGSDTGTIHNLGILAAKSGLATETMAIALDAFDEPNFHTAFRISLAFIANNEGRKNTDFEDLLVKLASEGHFETKLFLLNKKMRPWGWIALPVRIAYTIYITVFSLIVYAKNKNDPKLGKIFSNKT